MSYRAEMFIASLMSVLWSEGHFSYSCGHKETFPRIPINGTLKESISIEVLFLFDLLTI